MEMKIAVCGSLNTAGTTHDTPVFQSSTSRLSHGTHTHTDIGRRPVVCPELCQLSPSALTCNYTSPLNLIT